MIPARLGSQSEKFRTTIYSCKSEHCCWEGIHPHTSTSFHWPNTWRCDGYKCPICGSDVVYRVVEYTDEIRILNPLYDKKSAEVLPILQTF